MSELIAAVRTKKGYFYLFANKMFIHIKRLQLFLSRNIWENRLTLKRYIIHAYMSGMLLSALTLFYTK